LVIERLSKRHERRAFDCGEESLNRFLREMARQRADRDLGIAFVAVPEPGSPVVVGYYTLVTATVTPAVVPDGSLPGQQDVPVIRLARLAVDRGWQEQGVGERLLFHALYRVQRVAEEVGVYAVVVDALHERARGFYEKYGFHSLGDDRQHLYMTLKVIRALHLHPMRSE